MDESTGTPPAYLPMNSPPLGDGAIDEATVTPPPSLPTNSPPTRHRAIHTAMNNPPVPHRVIDIRTEPIPAAADRFSKRLIKKSDAFALALFFASFGFLNFSLNNLRPGYHFAIALGLNFPVFIVVGFLYLYSCFRDPGPKFLKVKVAVLVFCVGLLGLAIFLTRRT